MTKFLVGLEKFLHSLTHSFCRHIVKTFTFLYLFLKQQKVLHLFCRHTTRRSEDSFAPPFFLQKNAPPDSEKSRRLADRVGVFYAGKALLREHVWAVTSPAL